MTILQTTFHNIDFTHNIVLPKNNEKIISHIQETLSNLSSLNIVQNKKLLEETIKQVTKFIQKKAPMGLYHQYSSYQKYLQEE